MHSKKLLSACTSECGGKCENLDALVQRVPEIVTILKRVRKAYESEYKKKKKTEDDNDNDVDTFVVAMLHTFLKNVEDWTIFDVFGDLRYNYGEIIKQYEKDDKENLPEVMSRFVTCIVSHVNDTDREILLTAIQVFVSLSNKLGNKWTVHFNTHMMKHLDASLKLQTRLYTKSMENTYYLYESRGFLKDIDRRKRYLSHSGK